MVIVPIADCDADVQSADTQSAGYVIQPDDWVNLSPLPEERPQDAHGLFNYFYRAIR